MGLDLIIVPRLVNQAVGRISSDLDSTSNILAVIVEVFCWEDVRDRRECAVCSLSECHNTL